MLDCNSTFTTSILLRLNLTDSQKDDFCLTCSLYFPSRANIKMDLKISCIVNTLSLELCRGRGITELEILDFVSKLLYRFLG